MISLPALVTSVLLGLAYYVVIALLAAREALWKS